MTELAGAVALVTGASSGIGAATAERLARAGATVYLAGRDAQRLAEVADRLAAVPGAAVPGTAAAGVAVPIAIDLAAPGSPQALVDRVLRRAGRVDVLVNNAGAGWVGRFTEMRPEYIDELLAVNLRAPIALTLAVLPGMRDRGSGGIVFVTSIAGRTGVRGEAVYSAAKAGLDVFAESLRLELAGTGVDLSVVVPGVVDTPFFIRRGQPYQRRAPRPIPAGRVADLIVAALRRGRAEAYAPAWLRVPVAVRSVCPGLYRRLAGRFG